MAHDAADGIGWQEVAVGFSEGVVDLRDDIPKRVLTVVTVEEGDRVEDVTQGAELGQQQNSAQAEVDPLQTQPLREFFAHRSWVETHVIPIIESDQIESVV